MELNLTQTIPTLRKAKGLTQEQLAAALGVSAPAVSKWETGASYPDITLLCPLARALDTTIDTLLQFEKDLTNEEINAHISHIIETANTMGTEVADEKLTALLHRYPNCIPLQFNAAMTYTVFTCHAPTAPRSLPERWTARKKELLLSVHSHRESPYWQPAAVQLAAMALQEDDLTAAEQLLSQLPETVVEPTATWVQLYQKQGKPDLALKTLQTRLFSLVQQVQVCLAAMTTPDITPDPHRALEICEVYGQVARLFQAGGQHHGLMLDILLAMGNLQAAADCLAQYVDSITQERICPNPTLFSPTIPPGPRTAFSKELRQLLLLGLDEEKYGELLKLPKARHALEQLKTSLQ